MVSPSYAFGFNNAIAILSMVAVLAAATVYCLLRGPEACRPRIRLHDDVATQRLPAWLFLAMAAIYAGLTRIMYGYAQRATTGMLTWESRHFLHRVKLMEVYGLRPYVDFQAEYGPALMYPPVYLHRVLAPFGVTVEGAYFLCHLVMNLAGLWCLFYLLEHVDAPRRRKAVAFTVVGLAGFAPYMGLSGVVLRYACPYASVLLGHRIHRLGRTGHLRERWRSTVTVAMVAALLAANIVLSPEIAVAFTLSWLVYVVLAARKDWRPLAASLVAMGATAVACWFMLPEAYYESLLRFSEGAINLPLVPAAHLVLYILTLALVVPALSAAGLRGGTPDAPLLGTLGALSVVMMPGALGRCDPPHVLFYGMGASLLLMIRLANTSRRIFVTYVAAYATIFIGMLQAANAAVFLGASYREIAYNPIRAAHTLSQNLRRDLTPRDLSYLSALDKYPQIGLPYATYGGDNAAESYLFDHRQVAPEYYVSLVGVFTDENLARKMGDVARHEYLLVKAGWEKPEEHDRCRLHQGYLRRWFIYPVRLECKRLDLDSWGELARFLAANYRPVERIGPSLVLRRVKAAPENVLSSPPAADAKGSAAASR
jgi:hypothetical protein